MPSPELNKEKRSPHLSRYCQDEDEEELFQEVKFELARENRCFMNMDCFWCGDEDTLSASLYTGGKGLVIRCSSCKIFLREGPHVDLTEYENHDVRKD